MYTLYIYGEVYNWRTSFSGPPKTWAEGQFWISGMNTTGQGLMGKKLGTLVTSGEDQGAGPLLICFPVIFGQGAMMEGIRAHDECWQVYWQHLQSGPQIFWSSSMWKSSSERKGGMRRSQLNQTEAL